MEHSLWSEIYRPTTLDEIILPKVIKDQFREQIKNKSLMNMLFSGPPGTGKTTLSKVLCLETNVMHTVINASAERGIDTVRNDIREFASNMDYEDTGPHRVVILEECNMLTPEAQSALNVIIEEYHKKCRFFFNTNFPDKLLESIRDSRCVHYDFNMNNDQKNEMYQESYKRVCQILTKEKIKFLKKDVKSVLIECIPNLRKALNTIQKSCVNGEFIYLKNTNKLDLINELIEMTATTKRNFKETRNWLNNNVSQLTPGGIIFLYYTKFIERVDNTGEAILRLAILISDYEYKLSLVDNKIICLHALFGSIIKDKSIIVRD